MFNRTDTFPITLPIVSFTGPIVGPGSTLLDGEAVPDLGNIQLKCCGFVQLSTYLAPGNPTRTPFKGFHPFQVFVIFPIHANPWTSLCKRMIERKETQFQLNVSLSCTGKVAGFLDHRIMVHPPQFTQDYVFIVVPDTWQFHDNASRDSISTSPLVTTPAKQPSADPFDPARFMSPSKPVTQQTTNSTMGMASFTRQPPHADPASLTPSSQYYPRSFFFQS
jgi:hypothetical protein